MNNILIIVPMHKISAKRYGIWYLCAECLIFLRAILFLLQRNMWWNHLTWNYIHNQNKAMGITAPLKIHKWLTDSNSSNNLFTFNLWIWLIYFFPVFVAFTNVLMIYQKKQYDHKMQPQIYYHHDNQQSIKY